MLETANNICYWMAIGGVIGLFVNIMVCACLMIFYRRNKKITSLLQNEGWNNTVDGVAGMFVTVIVFCGGATIVMEYML